jgi:hypothetical protein
MTARECPTCAEVAWLAAAGECRERIATRLGQHVDTLERHCYRHGLSAVWVRVQPLAELTPTPYR